MEFWEKEERFEQTLRSGRVPEDIWRYIPKKLYEAVDNAFVDLDGYWIWLSNGWRAYDQGEDCKQIHEYTIKDLKAALETVRRYHDQ